MYRFCPKCVPVPVTAPGKEGGAGAVGGGWGVKGGWELLKCPACNSGDREESMVICDKCEQGFHLYCLSPPLSTVPEGDWYDFVCV